MAGRDYIKCKKCYTKIVYDGQDDGRDRLETMWGDPSAKDWTVGLLCPDCIQKIEEFLGMLKETVDGGGHVVTFQDIDIEILKELTKK